MYLKSLDHMGIHVKAADKKNFAPKHLVDSIKTRHEEQRRQRGTTRSRTRYQFLYTFDDQDVIADVLRFMLLFIQNSNQHNHNEQRRVREFFEKFVTTFFDLSEDLVTNRTGDIDRGTPDDDLDDLAPTELPNGRGRRPVNGKKNDLRRGVLDKGRNGTRGRDQKEDSATGSKESTPDVDSLGEDEIEPEDHTVTEVTNERWAAVPGATAVQGTKALSAEERELNADKPYKRDYYSMFSNQTIYVFFTILHSLYQRFKDIKNSEEDAVQEGIRARTTKPAREVGLIDERESYFGPPDGETYYEKTLGLVEDYLVRDLDELKYQDFLRHFYLKKGWQLYTITDLLKQLCRIGVACSSHDPKEKTPDLLSQFYHDRDQKETSFNAEINLRKQADKYVKDAELFLIRWVCTSQYLDWNKLTESSILARVRQLCNGCKKTRQPLTSMTWN
jgi:paired amphipathic helix protein Sin3a